MIRVTGELDYSNAYIRLREPDKSEDKADSANVATKEAKENRIGMSTAIRWWRSCMRVRESIGRERGRRCGECRDKLQVPGQYRRAKVKELHKTSINELLIKIAESEGLQVDVGVLDQETK
ncbi:hypothetical protein B296_00039971 [Ensete ventricosum]|uniref:Uncharacterized protein n=1 Tax=Ensete ventricosum TaxID=4639 RepID=A0A426YBI0_ENSVE|nr:hypothetical protein B296_00039971 [Ensete ventricosum]